MHDTKTRSYGATHPGGRDGHAAFSKNYHRLAGLPITHSENKTTFRFFTLLAVASHRQRCCYPPTLITTADHDDRVVPAHSFKFAARLQAAQGCDKPVLIRIETKPVTAPANATTKIIQETADRWAFLVKELGVKTQK